MAFPRLPVRSSPAWVALLLVATALVFLPVQFVPSFDTPKLAVLVSGAAILTLAVAWRPRDASRDKALTDPILAIPLLLALAAAVGALVAWPRGSLIGPVTALACVAAARLVAQSGEPGRAVRAVARGAAVAAVVAGLYAIVQKAGLDFTPWAPRREVVATFGNTSFAAEFQAAALPLSLLLAVRRDGARADRALGIVAAALGVVHLAMATSRIDYVAAVAGLGAAGCLLLAGRGRTRLAAGLAAGGLVAGLALAIAFASGASWLGRSDTVAVRAGVWESTARMIADAPLRAGTTPFVDAFPAWRDAGEYRLSLGRRVETPHDDLLEVAATLGVPGLLAALGLVALIARRLVTATRQDAADTAALGGCLSAVLVSGLASSPLSHPATSLLPALAAGCLVALVPRPLRGHALPARATGVAVGITLAAAFAPGPVLRTLRSDGFVALAQQELAHGDASKSLKLLDAAAAADPQAFDARFQLGCLLTSAGRPGEAIASLESARSLRPGDPDCTVNLAYALRNAGRSADAARLVADALAVTPWHPLLLAAKAIFALEAGRDAEALDAATRAALGLPKEPRLRALAAQAALPRAPEAPGSDAVPSADTILAWTSTRGAALDALVGLFASGETEELGRSARAMLRRDPGLLGPLVTRARRLAASRPDEAAALVLAAASAVRDDGGFLDEASAVLRQTGRAEEATILLGRSLGVRASEALAAGDAARALKYAGQAAERDPCPGHHLLAARAAVELGETAAAFEEIGAAIAAGPVDAASIRSDPLLSKLLPNPRLEELLDRAERRSGEIHGAPGPR